MRDKEGNLLKGAHIVGFYRRICKLLYFGIRPVFIFDGDTPAMKRVALTQRRKRKTTAKSNLARTAHKILYKRLQLQALQRSEAESTQSTPVVPSIRSDTIQELPSDVVYMDEIEGGQTSGEAAAPSVTEGRRRVTRKNQSDAYELPSETEGVTSIAVDDPRFITEEEMRDFIDSHKHDLDLSALNLDAQAFKELPVETQHDIVTQLKNKSRQSDHRRLTTLTRVAPNAMEFSKIQIKHLVKRNELTTRLQDLAKNANITSNPGLKKWKAKNANRPQRIASERAREYVLVKNDEGGGFKIKATPSDNKVISKGLNRETKPVEVIDLEAPPEEEVWETEDDDNAIAAHTQQVSEDTAEAPSHTPSVDVQDDDEFADEEFEDVPMADSRDTLIHPTRQVGAGDASRIIGNSDLRDEKSTDQESLLSDFHAYLPDDLPIEKIMEYFETGPPEGPLENGGPAGQAQSSMQLIESDWDFEKTAIIPSSPTRPAGEAYTGGRDANPEGGWDLNLSNDVEQHTINAGSSSPQESGWGPQPVGPVSWGNDAPVTWDEAGGAMESNPNVVWGEDPNFAALPGAASVNGTLMEQDDNWSDTADYDSENQHKPNAPDNSESPSGNRTPMDATYGVEDWSNQFGYNLDTPSVSRNPEELLNEAVLKVLTDAATPEGVCDQWKGVLSDEFTSLYPDHEEMISAAVKEWTIEELQDELQHAKKRSEKAAEGSASAKAHSLWSKILDYTIIWKEQRDMAEAMAASEDIPHVNINTSIPAGDADLPPPAHDMDTPTTGTKLPSPLPDKSEVSSTLSAVVEIAAHFPYVSKEDRDMFISPSLFSKTRITSENKIVQELTNPIITDRAAFLARKSPIKLGSTERRTVSPTKNGKGILAFANLSDDSDDEDADGAIGKVPTSGASFDSMGIDEDGAPINKTTESTSRNAIIPNEVEMLDEDLMFEEATPHSVEERAAASQRSASTDSTQAHINSLTLNDQENHGDHDIPVELENSDDEDQEDLEANIDVPTHLGEENEEYARFVSELSNQTPESVAKRIESEMISLNRQKRKEEAGATDIETQFIRDIQELLRIFGLPYLTAPMEAESQCAWLVTNKLVDGIVTDDSDVFLFGGTKVYKNMFNNRKYVEEYTIERLEENMKLGRDNLVQLAYLLGSDYTEGVEGVGAVLAMEVLDRWKGEELDPLKAFKEWWVEVLMDPMNKGNEGEGPGMRKLRKLLRKLPIPRSFPDPRVREAYINPQIDNNPTPFVWGHPDMPALRDFMEDKLDWKQHIVDQVMLPLLKEMQKARQDKSRQVTLDGFFGTTGAGASKVGSARVREIVGGWKGISSVGGVKSPAGKRRKLGDTARRGGVKKSRGRGRAGKK